MKRIFALIASLGLSAYAFAQVPTFQAGQTAPVANQLIVGASGGQVLPEPTVLLSTNLATLSTTQTIAGTKTFTAATITTATINGGTINNTSVGATTPSTGAFTVLKETQFLPTGTTPTMAAGAAAGTTPTCTTVAGTNVAGVITCTTGTATTTGILSTITFNGTLATAPQGCQLTPRTALTAPAATSVFTTAPTTTTWTVSVATALTASTAYSWYYTCI